VIQVFAEVARFRDTASTVMRRRTRQAAQLGTSTPVGAPSFPHPGLLSPGSENPNVSPISFNSVNAVINSSAAVGTSLAVVVTVIIKHPRPKAGRDRWPRPPR